MSIRVALNHRTGYSYDRPVILSPQIVRLRPAPHCRTRVVSYSFKATPSEHFLNWQQDPHGNFLARLVFPEAAREFKLEVDLVAEMTVINPFDFFLEPSADNYPFRYEDWLGSELQPYLKTLPVEPRVAEFIAALPRSISRTVDFLVEVNRLVQREIKYMIRLEPGVQTPEETLGLTTGSCRDSAWLLTQVLRNLGLAARFVSGYLIQLKPDVQALDGPSGAGQDFTDLHAWTEVYLPGAGWIGLDPTSGLLAGEGHLPLAATPDPASAAPITGAVGPCQSTFSFQMSVRRIHEDPRVTRPYTDEQWARIQSAGQRVDAALDAGDVKLTMGGEPTLVSIDDMEGAEWNSAALGSDKRRLAGDLFHRLARQFATSPLLHFGQGKWYPGEQLPRWALGCYWRADGQPIWRDPRWIAEDRAYGHQQADARKFIQALAERLQVSGEHVISACEDAWHYLWKERRLPVNVDPLNSRLDDPLERARLAQVFQRGLNHVVGFALPLRPLETTSGKTRWQSGRWHFRDEHMFLMPGDSPMGFRLPLDSLPWLAPEDRPQLAERDPFEKRGELPSVVADEGLVPSTAAKSPQRVIAPATAGQAAAVAVGSPRESQTGQARLGESLLRVRQAPSEPSYDEPWMHARGNGNGHARGGSAPPFGAAADPATVPIPRESAHEPIRTALCVEPRDGVLHIFMPPIGRLEDYLALVATIEDTVAELSLPVRIEGYSPPYDYRLRHFKVTPDPGVIEVNMPPAHDWDELVRNTLTLYEQARQSRLGTEKFNLDGRHTGTGGGNHLVFGGATPAESPILRRPDLLRSLLAYWNNRPSLSYLFSGQFIGPTSQAPRVDEARHESLYELETAFSQIPTRGACPPWLVDRAFRHLLADVTGNTHRAEFCIDKLFAPESSHGRLGLLEFRGFEMPPHAQMSLTQQLLMRALIARFWREPYRQPLAHWGTSLHDRFMLPHFVSQDFAEVIEELREAGFDLQRAWFDPHFEFRFPLLGHVTHHGIQLELRQAIEPWHVLGEEPGATGTARYVDSSVERLEVKVRGMTDGRYVIACNGRRVPLHPTGTHGEHVAGVRYRAWQPESCLHPLIGIHTPLVFDVLDTWNDRSIGGCTWHVAHPGGRHFETFPVNANEAESRRAARFFPIGHTGLHQRMPQPEPNRAYPLTLDLRRPVV